MPAKWAAYCEFTVATPLHEVALCSSKCPSHLGWTHQILSCLFTTVGLCPGEIWNWLPYIQRTRKDQRKRQNTPDWKVAIITWKGIYKDWLRQVQTGWSLHPPIRILQVYSVSLTRLVTDIIPDVLSNTLLVQSCVPKVAPNAGKVGRIYILRTEQPPIARSQLRAQQVVMSSYWPPPT